MKHITILFLFTILISCESSNDNSIADLWITNKISPKSIVNWIDLADSILIENTKDIRSEYSNPLLYINSELLLKQDSTYHVTIDSQIIEKGKWISIDDSLIKMTFNNLTRNYEIAKRVTDTLILIEDNHERVKEFYNNQEISIGTFKDIRITLIKK